ncbi:iron chaperone [Cellulomonas oligotrophica]|uniref:Uncharacterized protein YdhG (YjbR/CyaY superfamily) n=1 Tax=Cellulomonas oligotrophica TaxID=931536 RepID=A0A7Y9JZK6_9CELL|nr:DUF1801 domain-containing protein [Cellulomonas oligotrophica]NYD87992.1 uncharacterized protein YdhG (YjbR/CyaY superfamily) [Cellulomonas oligotrophica]GIG34487.1 hypothetical protein Col01nite_36460 [Cellulomonas oligotrophica]
MARTTTTDATEGFTAQERAAMKERAAEVRAQARRGGKAAKAAEQEAEVLAKIAEMPDADRVLAERVHALVRTHAPELAPRTWYGMPAYARGDKVLCFFQGADKFTARYATLGFNDAATLDDGPMWPTAFALTQITPAVEERILDLLRRAAG